MNLSPEHAHLASLAEELDESLRRLSYPEYRHQIWKMLGELLEYYRPELPEDVIALAERTLRLLDPTTPTDQVEADQAARAWRSVTDKFRPKSRNVLGFCYALSDVDVQVSGHNFSIGVWITGVLISDIFRPSLPSEACLPFTGFPVPAGQAEGDLRMMNQLLASVRQHRSD